LWPSRQRLDVPLVQLNDEGAEQIQKGIVQLMGLGGPVDPQASRVGSLLDQARVEVEPSAAFDDQLVDQQAELRVHRHHRAERDVLACGVGRARGRSDDANQHAMRAAPARERR